MNLETLGNIGDFVGGIAVIVTLAYLAVQMRLNTKAIQHSNTRQAAAAQSNALQLAVGSEEQASLSLKGFRSLSELTDVERYRFDLGLLIWLQAVEQAFADHRDGIFPYDSLLPYINAVAGFLNTPGGSAWWNQRKTWFTVSFREEVDTILSNASAESLADGPIIQPGQ
jgi:hypothetical protein